MIGRLLGNRYEVLERLGGGGMAVVYKARDLYLHRKVAVKVLRPQFAGDENFVRRFRREAQSAASLSHPNVVAIYDVGQYEDTHYIVMEYVEGTTLKEKIRQEGALPVPLALEIATRIAEALEHAHQNGIIHRDIKPHNILLSANGRVKVADFGIARASTGATLTHTGSMIGSAHYFSPEQARGSITGERSDLYSLGVVLYEMVTGRVPFDGDSPVTVAIRHLQEEVPNPRQFNRGLPREVEAVIMKAMQKEEFRRYHTATQLRRDLERCLAGLVGGEELEDTLVVAQEPARAKLTEGPKRAHRTRKRYLLWAAGLAVMATALAFGVVEFYRWLNVPIVTVPPVEGLSLAEAQRELERVNLAPQIDDPGRYDPRVPANHVISQDPEAGQQVKAGRKVRLVISKGPELVAGGVPEVEKLHVKEALIRLESVGLVGKVVEVNHPEVPEDYVIRQNPRAGVQVPTGSEVVLEVSTGPAAPLILPDFSGEQLENVQLRLKELGLLVGTVSEQESRMPPGVVVGQTPAPGTTVVPGSEVALVVSKGGLSGTPRSTVRVSVPGEGQGLREVEIVVYDNRGRRTVYKGSHPPGETFSWPVEWGGTQARVQILIDGEVKGEEILQ